MKSDDDNLGELVEKYMTGVASEYDVANLNEAMESDAAARQVFLAAVRLDTNLRDEASGLDAHESVELPVATIVPSWRRQFGLPALAATVLALATIALLSWTADNDPSVIAKLVSSENAGWESLLPTVSGSELTPGTMKLTTGMATIRFSSGAEVILTAPSLFVLETPMRGKLLAGSAVIEVPDSAIGFVMDTPVGYAVDHGTQFAVTVDAKTNRSEFDVLSGEISVFQPHSTHGVRLANRQSASLDEHGPLVSGTSLPEKVAAVQHHTFRIGTEGREASIIANDQRKDFLHPDLLMAKKSVSLYREYDRRSLFVFEIKDVDVSGMFSARIRLILVPSGIGFAACLPRVNKFSIYGLKDESAEDWSAVDLKWKDAPALEQCVPLGSFDVPRSVQHGSFGIESDALTKFLQSDTTGKVGFVLVRETGELQGSGLVHAFASSQNGEALGPILEIQTR